MAPFSMGSGHAFFGTMDRCRKCPPRSAFRCPPNGSRTRRPGSPGRTTPPTGPASSTPSAGSTRRWCARSRRARSSACWSAPPPNRRRPASISPAPEPTPGGSSSLRIRPTEAGRATAARCSSGGARAGNRKPRSSISTSTPGPSTPTGRRTAACRRPRPGGLESGCSTRSATDASSSSKAAASRSTAAARC